MITLGEIFRRYGPAYREKVGERLSARERVAMAAIEHCRTEALGGHIYTCPRCATVRYSYHSCRNRHYPTCQHDQAQIWLAKQQALLLPIPYFLVTFTLPAELRVVARQHPRRLYGLLFRSSARALQEMAADRRFVGGQLGMVGVLQTWTRDLRYHPHIHYLVPAGAYASAEGRWVPAKGGFLVHVKPLAKLFRGKMRAGLRQVKLEAAVPSAVWSKAWVVDCRAVGSGEAALKYLAPYVFRVALSNNRLEAVVHDQVTFRYRVAESKKTKRCTLPAEVFIRRFLQHVLPRGFVKVRYFGWFSPGKRAVLAKVRALLDVREGAVGASSEERVTIVAQEHKEPSISCPNCGAVMELTLVLLRASRSPP
ncbi:MAG TPA: IS91 family transposase [Herpetosiphonaceae bacterium]|nr:IS91 family transposase [Herpetosiphonaceae bacterium]